MVRIDDRLKKIKEEYVDYRNYFVINRGRQYGKTTTLEALRRYLKDDYTVLSLDFQQIGTEDFADASTFVQGHKFASDSLSGHQYNSPWNIAAKFKLDMDFTPGQIASMLDEYERDYHTGMDIQAISREIYQYTSGYPVLVSSICKCIDEELPDEEGFADLKSAWTKAGVARA